VTWVWILVLILVIGSIACYLGIRMAEHDLRMRREWLDRNELKRRQQEPE
jgi:hypothetical protein